MKKTYFKYVKIDPSQLKKLIAIESKIANFVDTEKPFYFRIMPDHFSCIVHTIISQQISNAAVDSIWNKVIAKFKKLTPKIITNASLETLRDVGLSESKIRGLKQISYDIVDKKLNLKKLEKLSDKEIYEKLGKYHSIGKWSIDMILIFSYYRNNIISFQDFGIKNGIKILFSIKDITPKICQNIYDKFCDNLTLLSLVLWKISNESNSN